MRTERSFRFRLILALAALLGAAAAPAWAQPPYPPPPPPGPGPGPGPGYYHYGPSDRFGEFRLWVGGFQPDAHDDYWNNKFRDFTGSRGDLRDVIGGGDFISHFARYNAVMIPGSFYSTTVGQSFRNFLPQNNNRIRHHTHLHVSSSS